jgi:hypothetical protein
VSEKPRVEGLGERVFPRPHMVRRYEELLAMGRADLAAEYFERFARVPMTAEEVRRDQLARERDYQYRLRTAKGKAQAIVDGIKHRREVAAVNAQGIKRRLGPKVEGIRRLLEGD